MRLNKAIRQNVNRNVEVLYTSSIQVDSARLSRSAWSDKLRHVVLILSGGHVLPGELQFQTSLKRTKRAPEACWTETLSRASTWRW